MCIYRRDPPATGIHHQTVGPLGGGPTGTQKMRGFSERAPSAVFTATVCILFQQIVKQHFQRVNV